MSQVPENLLYTKTHEWVRQENDDTLTVGMTDNAQSLLGDVSQVTLPKINSTLKAGAHCCTVESVKAATDIYAPVDGKVIAINPALKENAKGINSDPYGKGWLFKIKPSKEVITERFLDAKAYKKIEL
ncbi:MAG: glycine cleavage system protein GcvH [Pseudomonadota bacterium]|nr:glycine cleavage system protein GcvH [Gammaproteobacteria bacterium]MBU1558687.1 glycine cleavage system protein GcvH [Gammaproteobacteria bacterium]MBU1629357.1 glycine cleavage system protein GcvH [Gammaproteobacteria bacterium]MBU1926738.1 glycine cleavage system protein GcvH [Gammaproteobacteria bacterium]MBU2546448.1 glycine cleavage system protein GcvH [Gammaproteobacteria bacterium]